MASGEQREAVYAHPFGVLQQVAMQEIILTGPGDASARMDVVPDQSRKQRMTAPGEGQEPLYEEEESIMKVLKPQDIPAEAANSPLFTGGSVTRQPLLTPETSQNFNLGIVNFAPGARNKMHTHSSDQVLFVTAGKGIIATETTQEVISVGDVVHIPAEEKHWHGATPESAFSHIALTAKGSTTTQVEE